MNERQSNELSKLFLENKLLNLIKKDGKILQVMGQLHVLEDLSFRFAMKAVKRSADMRVPETKKLARAVKEIEAQYQIMRRKEVNPELLRRVHEAVEEFESDCARDFYILWLSVNAEFKKRHPNAAYSELRTDAQVARVFLMAVRRMTKEADRRLKKVDIQMDLLTHCQALETLLKEFAGDFEIAFDSHIETCYKILLKKCEETDFSFIKC